MSGMPLRSMSRRSRPEAHGQPGGGADVVAGVGQQARRGQPGLADLDPVAAGGGVDLDAADRVRVLGVDGADAPAGQGGGRDGAGHGEQVAALERRPAPDAPQVDLVRLAHVMAVDAVAPVDQAGADQQHVAPAGVGGQLVERRRDHGRGLRAQQHVAAQPARVAGVARDAVGRVVQAIVVVARRHHRQGAADAGLAAPRGRRGRRRCWSSSSCMACGPCRRIGEIARGDESGSRDRGDIESRGGSGRMANLGHGVVERGGERTCPPDRPRVRCSAALASIVNRQASGGRAGPELGPGADKSTRRARHAV